MITAHLRKVQEVKMTILGSLQERIPRKPLSHLLPVLWRTTDETMVKVNGVIMRGLGRGGQGAENFKIYPDRLEMPE